MTDFDDLDTRGGDRHAFEWGLASLLMGGFLALGAPITLIFNAIIWLAFPRAIPPQFTRLLFYIGILATVIVLLACLLSFVFGIKAWRSASATGHPSGLAVAGTLVSAIAFGAWLFVGIDLIMILGTYENIKF